METLKFTFDIAPDNSTKPLGIEVWFDNQLILDQSQLTQSQSVSCEFDDDQAQTHCVKIVVKNKTSEHTKINEQGEIIQDSLIKVTNFKLDDIDVNTIVHEKSVYTHNFNGSQDEVKDRFYGDAGCNGTIEIEFSSPSYLWLLENM